MADFDLEDEAIRELVGAHVGKAKENKEELAKEENLFNDVEENVTTVAKSTKKYSEITGSVPAGKEDFDIPCFTEKDWEEEDRAHIPVVDPTFVWDHDVAYPLLRAYCLKLKILVVGPTGSGKTATNCQIAAHLCQPYLRINGRQDMESDTLLGKPWVTDGETTFILGELPKALRKGWYVAFDEPWKTPSGIQMSLQRFYERGGVLQLDDMPGTLDEKIIVPDDRTFFVLCDNVVGTGDSMDQYGATLIQDASTINRMDLVLYQDYLKQDQEVKLITNKYSYIPEHMAKKAVQLASLIRSSFTKGDLAATLSPRNLQSWMEVAYTLKNYEEAFTYVMLNRYAEDAERASVKGHYLTVFNKHL